MVEVITPIFLVGLVTVLLHFFLVIIYFLLIGRLKIQDRNLRWQDVTGKG
jgi:hypothetical protein